MTRRDLSKVLAAIAFTHWFPSAARRPITRYCDRPSQSRPKDTGAASPQTVAGIWIVDSAIAKQATELARDTSDPVLFNHAMRTFLFAALIGRALNQRFDEELLYLACILHDLGLTERFMGALPFEVQGAQAAKAFLDAHGLAKDRCTVVWDGIAMHPLTIGQFKQPEVALVGAGAGADVVGPDFSQISKAEAAEVLRAFPRLNFRDEFVKICATVVRKYPRGASHTFMRDIGERYVPNFHLQNLCDLIRVCPLDE